LNWLDDPIAPLHTAMEAAARARQDQLTKPPGSLGRLERIAIKLAALQGRERPRVDKVHVSVFAADHGVAAEGVSAFPQAVTREMIRNFARGGAAICVLSRTLGARLEVIDLGTVSECEPLAGVVNRRLGPGSANFCQGPAMSEHTLHEALAAGAGAVDRAIEAGAELFIGGEMGIANTTAATAIGAALLGVDPLELAGPGTGISREQIRHKAEVIARGLALHQSRASLEVLRCLGGFEIAALTGSYIRAAQRSLPVLVDGFITTAAALVACSIRAEARGWLLFGHRSAEPGHRLLLAALEAEPVLDIDMRLGEGSGAAVAAALLRSACALHAEMATFAEADVSEKAC
jgi:nicotinate-nucleotide--dimethylbenzimidazole phosphoribosyltransferase